MCLSSGRIRGLPPVEEGVVVPVDVRAEREEEGVVDVRVEREEEVDVPVNGRTHKFTCAACDDDPNGCSIVGE